MANADGGHALIDELVRSAARTYQWPGFAPQRRETAALDPAVLDGHAGDYEVREYGIVLSVVRKDDHLIVNTPRGSYYKFSQANGNDYFAIEDSSASTFVPPTQNPEPPMPDCHQTRPPHAKKV